ncbi:hypothetical protein K449DRAFT_436842 [Hypoxylon sp. EC38]|nr:hypothetical protein K449DRAFT_436842 [Hypoxylon sp. EC38]
MPTIPTRNPPQECLVAEKECPAILAEFGKIPDATDALSTTNCRRSFIRDRQIIRASKDINNSVADEGVISTSQCYALKYLETIIVLYHSSPLSATYSPRHNIAPDDAEDDDYDVVIFEPSQFTTLNLVLHEVIVSADYTDGTESPYNVELPSWSKKSFPRTPSSKLEVPIECISHERWLTQESSLWVIQCHQYPIQEITKTIGVTGVKGQVPSARPKLVDDYTFLQRGRTPRTTFPVRPAGTKATTHTFPYFSHHPIVSQTPLVILSFDVVPFWLHDAVNAPRSGRYLFRGFKTPVIPEDT